MKIDKSKWTGEQLYEFYTSLGGDYSQTLYTARMAIGDDLLPVLEKCERDGKVIELVDADSGNDDPGMKIIFISKPQ